MKFYVISLSIFFVISHCIAGDTIAYNESIRDGKNLISAGGSFKLGFFKLGSSKNRYLGIWYGKISMQTYVWIANRDRPLKDSTGVLKIGLDGNLILVDQAGTTFWSSNISKVRNNTVAQLQDSGNLELRVSRKENPYKHPILWQSFDHPTDTLLPGMKLGLDFRSGANRQLTSWKGLEDPSQGDFIYKIDPNGLPQSFVWQQNSSPVVRSGPWFGLPFSSSGQQMYNDVVIFKFIANSNEVYYSYRVKDSSVVMRLVICQLGTLQRLVWHEKLNEWDVYWYVPKDQCDNYNGCGAYGVCNSDSPFCKCLVGFEQDPKRKWNLRDGSNRCKRREKLSCQGGDGFKLVSRLKLPDTSNATVDMSLSLDKCRDFCLRNCSCTAYTAANYSVGSGCLMWTGELLDIKEFSDGGQDLYIRLAASELGNSRRKAAADMAVAVSIIVLVMILIASTRGWFMLWDNKRGMTKVTDSNDERCMDFQAPLFSFETIALATNNFCNKNMLGKGSFGPVYKGKLEDGQEIAVKRLSRSSHHGLCEFMTEVNLIAKLQHRNLVRLIGCCIEGDEKMLIYEYMPNGSLNAFIFESKKSQMLDWKRRMNIISGIARGILYLHQDSRLRIIHRDLKASNILLTKGDGSQDFRLRNSRMLNGNQVKDETTTVVGHMKSDVFSFGVLTLEIISGKKNRGVYKSEAPLTLLGYTWKLWTEGRLEKLVDKSVGLSEPISEVLRCIQIGLLCVQERAVDRPDMSSVVFMLGSDNLSLPLPKKPGFSSTRTMAGSSTGDCSSIFDKDFAAVGELTLTVLEGR